jgi:DNA-repair protein complementing XP-A cells
LTEEQLARIEENRQKALLKRKLAESLKAVEVVDTEAKQVDLAEQEAQKHISETSKCTVTLPDGSVCGKCPVDHDLCEYFGEFVCKSCKFNTGDTYKTISRGECISAYLIPEDSLKVLKFMNKDNPHHVGWTPMKLYLRKHAVELALRRFGTLEALEDEKKKREAAKFERSLVKTDDILAKQSAVFRDVLQKDNGASQTADLTEDMTVAGTKRVGTGGSSKATGLNAKRRKMVNDFLSCLK